MVARSPPKVEVMGSSPIPIDHAFALAHRGSLQQHLHPFPPQPCFSVTSLLLAHSGARAFVHCGMLGVKKVWEGECEWCLMFVVFAPFLAKHHLPAIPM